MSIYPYHQYHLAQAEAKNLEPFDWHNAMYGRMFGEVYAVYSQRPGNYIFAHYDGQWFETRYPASDLSGANRARFKPTGDTTILIRPHIVLLVEQGYDALVALRARARLGVSDE